MRKSTEEATRQETSLDDQRKAIVQAFGPMSLDLWFEDSASGTRFENEGFLAMEAFCRAHPQPKQAPGWICMYDTSRFGRVLDDEGQPDPEAMAVRRWQLKQLGWLLKFVLEPDTGSSLIDPLTFHLRAYAAGEKSATLSATIRRGKRSHGEQGYWIGGRAPYGTRRQDPHTGRVLEAGERCSRSGSILVPHQEELAVWHWAAARLLEGKTTGWIATELRRREQRSRRGKYFTVHTLRRVLSCSALIAEPEHRLADGTVRLSADQCRWAPIVEPRLWYDVQAALGPRKDPITVGSTYCLALYCAHCGMRYGTSWKPFRLYRHRSIQSVSNPTLAAEYGQHGCRSWVIGADQVEAALRQVILETCVSPNYLRDMQQLFEAQHYQQSSAAALVGQLEATVRRLEGEKEQILTNMLSLQSPAVLRALERQVDAKDEALRSAAGQLTQARVQQEREATRWNELAAVVDESRQVLAAWDSSDPEDRFTVLQHWIPRMDLHVEAAPSGRALTRRLVVYTLVNPARPHVIEMCNSSR